jgi:hypothetical protein
VDKQLQTAISKILRPVHDDYFQAHHDLWPDWWSNQPPSQWQPLLFNYPRLTVIGAAHSNNIDSPILNRIKTHVTTFLADQTTPPTQKLVMVEGFTTGRIPRYRSIDQAIQYMGESGMTAFLALQAEVATISPEVITDPTSALHLKEQLLSLFSPEQNVLYALLDSLTSLIRKNELTPERIAGLIVHYARIFGSDWQHASFTQSADLLNHINAMMIKYLDQPLFQIEGNHPTLLLDQELIIRLTDNTIFKDADHPYAGYLNDIARILDANRDNYLVTAIHRAHQQQKTILLVFGGSHIIAIKPALDFLYS